MLKKNYLKDTANENKFKNSKSFFVIFLNN